MRRSGWAPSPYLSISNLHPQPRTPQLASSAWRPPPTRTGIGSARSSVRKRTLYIDLNIYAASARWQHPAPLPPRCGNPHLSRRAVIRTHLMSLVPNRRFSKSRNMHSSLDTQLSAPSVRRYVLSAHQHSNVAAHQLSSQRGPPNRSYHDLPLRAPATGLSLIGVWVQRAVSCLPSSHCHSLEPLAFMICWLALDFSWCRAPWFAPTMRDYYMTAPRLSSAMFPRWLSKTVHLLSPLFLHDKTSVTLSIP